MIATSTKCHCGCGAEVGGRNGGTRPGTNRFVHGHNRRVGITTADRFNSRIKLSKGHWLWTGSLHGGAGYGKLDGDFAHRVAWRLFVGPVPKGRYIDHVCRVRSCVNPKHLRVVTPRQNSLENSGGFAAVNALKQTCLRGHEFTPKNTYHYGPSKAYRQCRKCNALRQRSKA